MNSENDEKEELLPQENIVEVLDKTELKERCNDFQRYLYLYIIIVSLIMLVICSIIYHVLLKRKALFFPKVGIDKDKI